MTLGAAYFDALYARDPDPWRFETSPYEDSKYAATLAALPRPRYTRAVEFGCSIGVLTARLAGRCGTLLGVDVAQAALDQAAARCAGLANVAFAQLRLPDEMPTGRFDLVLLSEVLYYFDRDGLAALASALQSRVAPGGDVVLVHWLGETPDYPLTGEAAVVAFEDATADWLGVTQRTRTPDYRLDVFRALPAA